MSIRGRKPREESKENTIVLSVYVDDIHRMSFSVSRNEAKERKIYIAAESEEDFDGINLSLTIGEHDGGSHSIKCQQCKNREVR